MRRLTLLCALASASLGLSASTAQAQVMGRSATFDPQATMVVGPVQRPFLGVSLGAGFHYIDALAARASARSVNQTSVAPGLTLGARALVTRRLLLHLEWSWLGWQSRERFPEFAETNDPRYTHRFVLFPIDVGLRVNVLPTIGPVRLYVGGGVRGTIITYQETTSSSVVQGGTGFSFGAYADATVEVVQSRAFGVEIFARYALGLAGGGTGGPGSRFENTRPLGGLMLGLLGSYYF